MLFCPVCERRPERGTTCPECGATLVARQATDDVSGQLLANKYAVGDRIGEGGMATVYRARRLPQNRLVAIKVLRAGAAATDPNIGHRFLREGQMLRRLIHPNIVELIDVGQTPAGLPYLVLELLEGRPLGQCVPPTGLPVEVACRIFEQICAGVAAAHDSGIVHRDLKPNNAIVIGRVGLAARVKVLDFGLARMLDAGHESLTQAGLVIGTPGYIAPEQIDGSSPADERSDVYALGALLLYLLTGRPAYGGGPARSVLSLQLVDGPDLSALAERELPRAFEGLIQTAMALDPLERFQAVSELLERLNVVRVGDPDGESESDMPVGLPDLDSEGALPAAVVDESFADLVMDVTGLGVRPRPVSTSEMHAPLGPLPARDASSTEHPPAPHVRNARPVSFVCEGPAVPEANELRPAPARPSSVAREAPAPVRPSSVAREASVPVRPSSVAREAPAAAPVRPASVARETPPAPVRPASVARETPPAPVRPATARKPVPIIHVSRAVAGPPSRPDSSELDLPVVSAPRAPANDMAAPRPASAASGRPGSGASAPGRGPSRRWQSATLPIHRDSAVFRDIDARLSRIVIGAIVLAVVMSVAILAVIGRGGVGGGPLGDRGAPHDQVATGSGPATPTVADAPSAPPPTDPAMPGPNAPNTGAVTPPDGAAGAPTGAPIGAPAAPAAGSDVVAGPTPVPPAPAPLPADPPGGGSDAAPTAGTPASPERPTAARDPAPGTPPAASPEVHPEPEPDARTADPPPAPRPRHTPRPDRTARPVDRNPPAAPPSEPAPPPEPRESPEPPPDVRRPTPRQLTRGDGQPPVPEVEPPERVSWREAQQRALDLLAIRERRHGQPAATPEHERLDRAAEMAREGRWDEARGSALELTLQLEQEIQGLEAGRAREETAARKVLEQAAALDARLATLRHDGSGRTREPNEALDRVRNLVTTESYRQAQLEAEALVPTLREAVATACLERGASLHARRQYEAAIATYDEALSLSPNRGNLYYNRGIARFAWERDQHPGAVGEPSRVVATLADFDRALAIEPGHNDARYARGLARAYVLDVVGAARDLEVVCRATPERWDGWYQLGRVYGLGGLQRKALDALAEAGRRAPPQHRSAVETLTTRIKRGES